MPILIHVFLWDRTSASPSAGSARFRPVSPPVVSLPPEIQLTRHPNENQIQPLPPAVPNEGGVIGDEPEIRLERDTAGEVSFRFHDFALPNNWV